jgi:hypothetical protein
LDLKRPGTQAQSRTAQHFDQKKTDPQDLLSAQQEILNLKEQLNQKQVLEKAQIKRLTNERDQAVTDRNHAVYEYE